MDMPDLAQLPLSPSPSPASGGGVRGSAGEGKFNASQNESE